MDLQELADDLRRWGSEFGFDAIGITDADVGVHGERFEAILDAGLTGGVNGNLAYLETHRELRLHPQQLEPGTLRVISARMSYFDPETAAEAVLADAGKGYIARYALGRDYHRVLRKRLARIGRRLHDATGAQVFRAFTDSAPVLEKGFAERAGHGWIGKNTLVLNEQGSLFFLGEIYTDLALPIDPPADGKGCGNCRACMTVCPTQAIVGPYQLDARRCISYLTIEHKGDIPEPLRRGIGNRIFGCDDCQLVCPWNRYARPNAEADFKPRPHLVAPPLLELWQWSEPEFLSRTEGTALRRLSYEQWQRNLAVALGNAEPDPQIVAALKARRGQVSALADRHIDWAISQQLAV